LRGAFAGVAAVMLVAVALVAAGCDRGPPIPAVDLALRVADAPTDVEFGRAFALTVEVVHRRDLVLDDRAELERQRTPLHLRLRETTVHDDGARVRLRLAYDAHVFATGDVVVPAATARARPRAGGTAIEARSEPFALSVRSALAADASAAPELDDELLSPQAARSPWLTLAAAAVAALIVVMTLARRSRRVPAVAPIAPPPLPTPDHDAIARERLARLRADAAVASDDAWSVAAATVVRDWLHARFAVPAGERTTEELLADAATTRALAARSRELLAVVLTHCDLVKFARRPLPAAERDRLLTSTAAMLDAGGTS
jgi:hypothetical protein